MPNWVKNLTVKSASQLPTIATLTALGALAFWGWSNDWQFSPARVKGPRTAKPSPAERAVSVVAASPSSVSRAGALTTSGLVRMEFPSPSAVDKVGILVAPVQVRDLTHSVTAPGMADYEPGSYSRLTARASGTVWRVYKDVGDPIHKGEVLALIEAAEVGKAKADFMLGLAQSELRDETLKSMRASASSLPEQTLRTAETAQRDAHVRLFNDRQALLNLGLPVNIADVVPLSVADRLRFMRLLGLPDEVRKGLDPETLTANLLPLTAPFDGQVVERNIATGEVVPSTQAKPLFVVGDIRRLHIDLDVNPEDVVGVRVGQAVTFRPNDGGPEVAGRVTHISPEVNDKTRRVQVHAEVQNKDRRLRPNTFGTGQIVVAERPSATVVPAEAVQSYGRVGVVFVRQSPTVFEARPVVRGLQRANLIEVSGVEQGDQVVTRGSYLLKSELQKDRITGGDE